MLFTTGTILLVSAVHASKGSATNNVPHIPDPLTEGAEIMREYISETQLINR